MAASIIPDAQRAATTRQGSAASAAPTACVVAHPRCQTGAGCGRPSARDVKQADSFGLGVVIRLTGLWRRLCDHLASFLFQVPGRLGREPDLVVLLRPEN